MGFLGAGIGRTPRELPERYPPYQTCHWRFQQWIRLGKLEAALQLLAAHLHERSRLRLNEAVRGCAPSRSAKKGGLLSDRRARTRVPRSSLSPLVTVYLSPYLSRAQRPAECLLVEEVLAGSFLDELPARLVGDKAYDSDALDEQLATEYGIELIAPNRRKRGKTQDGRCAGIEGAGKSSGFSPGCTTSAAWSRAGNATPIISSASSSSAV